jgi:hypothetical protein
MEENKLFKSLEEIKDFMKDFKSKPLLEELINLSAEEINAYFDSLSDKEKTIYTLINDVLNMDSDYEFKQGKICFPNCETYKARVYLTKILHEQAAKTTVKKFSDFENGETGNIIFDLPSQYRSIYEKR